MEIFCRTFFYSIKDIEDWDDEQHLEYILSHNLLGGQSEIYKNSGVGSHKIIDASGYEVWSVTTVICDW